MYSKFIISNDCVNILKYRPFDKIKGSRITSNYKNFVKEKINIKFKDGKIIDGSATQQEWFPQVKCDIFLSHSHQDIKKAEKLVGWFKNNLNLDVFIDYNVWGYINELLRLIDNDYCYDKNKKTYSYEKRNVTTSHVHMMLINAISEMMDKTECLLFLETTNSINLKKLTHNATTSSPWIYNEILLSKILKEELRRKKTDFEKTRKRIKLFSQLNENIEIEYDTDIQHLVRIKSKDLEQWQKFYNLSTAELNKNQINALDILYSIKNI